MGFNAAYNLKNDPAKQTQAAMTANYGPNQYVEARSGRGHFSPTTQSGNRLVGAQVPGATIGPANPVAAPPDADKFPQTPTPSAYGSQSGPGILESWFSQRANGTDPAYEYGMKRGGDEIDNRMAAGGSFNSGARGQQLSDFYANSNAQRMGQLDSLAGGASGEHQNRLNSMLGQGLSLAGGEAGLASAYDLGAAGNMQAAAQAQQQMYLNKAGVDQQANQGLINNGISLAKMYYGGGMGGGSTPAKM